MPQLILNIDMNTFLGFADRDLLLPRIPDRLARDGQVHIAGGLSRLANIIIRCIKRLAALQKRIDHPQHAGWIERQIVRPMAFSSAPPKLEHLSHLRSSAPPPILQECSNFIDTSMQK
nr:hypothetical protein [Paenibacillus dendritiformis]